MSLANPWVAGLIALFFWWFSTGILLWRVRHADNGGPHQHLLSVVYFLPLLGAGLFGIHLSHDDMTVGGAYIAFLSALAIWGWIELAFLSGIITGPNRRPCPAWTPLFQRFLRAIGTIAWHEIALLIGLVGLFFFTRGADNIFGFWTYAVLFFARISAKLNLFFGVPKINTEFLPRPLEHLPSHFRHAAMNPLFPVSVTALTFAGSCWLERIWYAQTPGAAVGFALLSALTLLALLEHWFMVLPLPDQKLWRWMMPNPKDRPADALGKDANRI